MLKSVIWQSFIIFFYIAFAIIVFYHPFVHNGSVWGI